MRGGWRVVVSGMLVSVTVALAGCSAPAPESRLQEYRERAEHIHAGMLRQVPGATAEAAGTSRAQLGEPQLLRGPEHDTAFWTTEAVLEVAAATTPVEVADEVGRSLLDQGWTTEPTVDQGGTMPFAKVYRLTGPDGEWVVQVLWSAGDGRRVSLSVQSPLTVRGAASPPG